MNGAPFLVANVLFRTAAQHYASKMGLLRVSACVGGTAVGCLPFMSCLHGGL